MRNFTFLLLGFLLSGNLLAQNTLTVKCFTDNRPYNSIELNGQVVEYGICDTGFYVGVFDYETCTIWTTNFNNNNPAHDFGNYNNNNSNCRLRSEGFFLFRYDQASELNGMLNMLQQIPDGNPVVIYTPMLYDPAMVASTSPALMAELETRWGAAIISDPEIKILFGNQGNAASFVSTTREPGSDSVVFSTPVCSSLGMDQGVLNDINVVQLSQGEWQIVGLETIQHVELYSVSGQKLLPKVNGNILSLSQKLSAGMYLLRGNSEKGFWQEKIVIQ